MIEASARLGPTKVNSSVKYRWLRAVILVGLVYVFVGTVFPNPPGSTQFIWRLAAWIISAVTFGVHVWYEDFRLGNSPRRTALHTSMSVALGAFGLAVAANLHSMQAGAGNRPLLLLALAIWPIMTGVPAFLVAFAATFALARIRPNDKTKIT